MEYWDATEWGHFHKKMLDVGDEVSKRVWEQNLDNAKTKVEVCERVMRVVKCVRGGDMPACEATCKVTGMGVSLRERRPKKGGRVWLRSVW